MSHKNFISAVSSYNKELFHSKAITWLLNQFPEFQKAFFIEFKFIWLPCLFISLLTFLIKNAIQYIKTPFKWRPVHLPMETLLLILLLHKMLAVYWARQGLDFWMISDCHLISATINWRFQYYGNKILYLSYWFLQRKWKILSFNRSTFYVWCFTSFYIILF